MQWSGIVMGGRFVAVELSVRLRFSEYQRIGLCSLPSERLARLATETQFGRTPI